MEVRTTRAGMWSRQRSWVVPFPVEREHARLGCEAEAGYSDLDRVLRGQLAEPLVTAESGCQSEKGQVGESPREARKGPRDDLEGAVRVAAGRRRLVPWSRTAETPGTR
ncbi:hypothetical protein GCM10009863_06500 [Streptomyces axinellae]|uniref:Uncharacterized protein n=1 Tax=Streptomyces axinellae TaxID=552788 RepID=A0ABP6C576_9ACTN